MKEDPWYQMNDSGTESQFAICPACNNPIQLIGLYHLPANVSAPYGRHIGQSITGLAAVNAEARESCPLFKPRRYTQTSRKNSPEGLPQMILEILISEFDRVIYLLQKQTGIRFSYNLVRKMLKKYRDTKGHLYMGASLINIPWIFAYMTDSQSLFMQNVSGNPELTKAIEDTIPTAYILDGRVMARQSTDKLPFIELNICFIHHHSRTDNGSWTEQMTMVVSTFPNSTERTQRQIIYQKQIVFDHAYFQNLRQFDDTTYRQWHWVKMAQEILMG